MAADASLSNGVHTLLTAAGGGGGGGGSSSPQSRRRSLPSPWAQVVRGEPESSSASSLPVSSAAAPGSPSSSHPPPIIQSSATVAAAGGAAPEQGSNSTSYSDSLASNPQAEGSVDNGRNATPPRRPVWNRPLNGVVEPVSVMGGAVSWPALSESTRPGPKSTTDSSRPISNGPSSAPQGPIVNQSAHRPVNANANANSNLNANHAMPGRQRPRRGGGGGGGSSSGNHNGSVSGHSGFNRPPSPPPPPLPPPFPVIEITSVPPVVMDSSVRGPRPMGGVGPQPHVPNDHSSQRSSSRRGHFGGRPRGDGSYHNNHGGRRDHDRGDVHMQQFVPPTTAFIPPPPPGTPPPYAPLPMRPFPNPMGFDMASPFIYVSTLPPEPFRGVPVIAQAPPPPMFYQVMEPNLPVMIVNQIDYYFSDENLVKDDFLRSNMDDEGWVPISLIAKFPRVAQLTASAEFIVDCMKVSTTVEIQGDKLRRREDWRRWIRMPARFNGDTDSPRTVEARDNILANSIQNVSLDGASSSRNCSTNAMNTQTETDSATHPPDESTSHSELSNGVGNAGDASSSEMQTIAS